MCKTVVIVALAFAALSGCSISRADGRHALFGGAVGAIAADVLGANPITGAAIGAGFGVLCGPAGFGMCGR